MPASPVDLDAEVPRQTPEEIERLARDMTLNLVWVGVGRGRDLDPFEGLLRMVVGRWSQGYIKSIAMIYEYLDEAIDIAPDGYPLFRSAKFLHRDDIPIYMAKVREVRGGQ